MEDIIDKHEEAIVDYYDTIMHEILEKTIEKHCDCGHGYLESLDEAKELNEVEDIGTIRSIFSKYNILGLYTKTTMDYLKKLDTEVNELRKILINQDKELAESLECIGEIVQKILSDYYFDVKAQKLRRICEFSFSKPTIFAQEIAREDDGKEYETKREFDLPERLEYYTSTFIESIENTFTKTKNYLDGGEIEVDLNSTISKVIDFCSEIDCLKTVGFLTKEISIYVGKRNIKKIAKLPASIIRPCAGKKNRLILTKGAYKIFTHYEHQFDELSWKRPVNKLASDSANRIISYLLKNPTISEIKSEDIVKGIVEGTSPLNPSKLFFKSGRTIKSIFGHDITSDAFFTRTGTCEIVNDQLVHYITEDTIYEHEYCALGYRLKLPWEDLSKYTITKPNYEYDYKYIKEKEEDQIAAIYEKINPGCSYVDPEKSK